MARQKFEKSFHTFVKGLMTEASEINFPENYSLYEKNFELRRDGGRDRRRGMELLYPLGVTLTSKLYPIEGQESLGARGGALFGKSHIRGRKALGVEAGLSNSGGSVVGGSHRNRYQSVSALEAGIANAGGGVLEGSHRTLYQELSAIEGNISNKGGGVIGGSIDSLLIRYLNTETGITNIGGEVVGGSLQTNNPILEAPYNLRGTYLDE